MGTQIISQPFSSSGMWQRERGSSRPYWLQIPLHIYLSVCQSLGIAQLASSSKLEGHLHVPIIPPLLRPLSLSITQPHLLLPTPWFIHLRLNTLTTRKTPYYLLPSSNPSVWGAFLTVCDELYSAFNFTEESAAFGADSASFRHSLFYVPHTWNIITSHSVPVL